MGRHALITGASSGIGAALAVELAARGYAVGLLARRRDRLDALADRIRARGGQVAVAEADVADREALTAGIRALEAALGPCDVLFANAGVGGSTPLDPMSAEQIAYVTRVNFDGAVYAVAAVLPGMLERGRGQLVGVTSIMSLRGLPGFGAYSGSKAALRSWWQSMRVALAPHGVVCTEVRPGYIDSEMSAASPGPKPFMLTAEAAARVIADGVARGRRVITLPLAYRLAMVLVHMLPTALFDPLARSLSPKPRRPR